MNVTDTELENKRKQAINDLVADSTTLAERLLKAESFGDTIRILRNHDFLMERVMALLPERKPWPQTEPSDALRAVVRRELVDIIGQAAKGG